MGDLTDRPVGWGIWGTGRVAEGFADDLGRLDGAELVAVASRRPESAREFASRHGGPRVHEALDDLAADPGVDVVYVATPNDRHADDAISCLRRGTAVLCEKPFTTTAEDARGVVAAARDHSTFCMEAMWTRFLPAVDRAKALIAGGAIGEPLVLHADFSVPSVVDAENRLFDPRRGGGALLDLGVYTLSLAQLLLGEPSSVQARLAHGSSGVDEHASVLLGYDSGATAVLTSSLRTAGPNSAVVSGTAGTIELPGPICAPDRLRVVPVAPSGGDQGRSRARRLLHDHPTAAKVLRTARRAAHAVRRPGLEVHAFDGHGYVHEAAEVARCLRAGHLESPRMPLDDSLRVVELMDRIRSEATHLGR